MPFKPSKPPGSTFKPIMALAGLESGAIDDNYHVNCGGGASFYGRYFKCWSKHGGVELHRGIVQSCDTFFYNVGNRLGIDRIAQYAEMVGFGQKTGIDLPHEAEGVVPSSKWKIRNFREKWYPGETISVSIGQGATTVTPIQLAVAMGGIAVGGMWFPPHLIEGCVAFVTDSPRRNQSGKHSEGGLRNVRRGQRRRYWRAGAAPRHRSLRQDRNSAVSIERITKRNGLRRGSTRTTLGSWASRRERLRKSWLPRCSRAESTDSLRPPSYATS